ncbi:MAG: hypothetical protein K0S47_3877 [Herbinix sp.]|jgi:hypothetical protein|nr:hypothetical protein [Herbinix sp.]
MSDLYSLLNDVTTDVTTYKKETLTSIDKAIMKKKVIDSLKKKRNYNSILKVACTVCAIILVGGIFFGNEIEASAKSIIWQINNFLGIDKDLQDYTTVLNTSQSDHGYTITLNEIILDERKLIITTTVQGDEKLAEIGAPVGDVYIYGKKASLSSGGSSKLLNDYTMQSISEYELINIDTKEELEIEINYNQIGYGETSIEGNWEFTFIADGSALAADTIHIPLNNEFVLPNKAVIHLTEYTRNSLGEKIYFTISGVSDSMKADYDMKLVGEDDLTNTVKFYLSYINGKEGRGCFVRTNPGRYDSSEATSVTLIPYAVKFPQASGRLSHDFVKAGEEITIYLD